MEVIVDTTTIKQSNEVSSEGGAVAGVVGVDETDKKIITDSTVVSSNNVKSVIGRTKINNNTDIEKKNGINFNVKASLLNVNVSVFNSYYFNSSKH